MKADLNERNFEGFHVTFYNHETRRLAFQKFIHRADVYRIGYTHDEPFPDLNRFLREVYQDSGDIVGHVADNWGKTLIDNRDEMYRAVTDII